MGFCTTISESENALRENLSSVSKSASREIFSSNRNHVYQIERNPLETQQEKLNSTYKTASGRSSWLGRDPIEEDGGINLYVFVGNDVFNLIDILGNSPVVPDGNGGWEINPEGSVTDWSMTQLIPDTNQRTGNIEFDWDIVKSTLMALPPIPLAGTDYHLQQLAPQIEQYVERKLKSTWQNLPTSGKVCLGAVGATGFWLLDLKVSRGFPLYQNETKTFKLELDTSYDFENDEYKGMLKGTLRF